MSSSTPDDSDLPGIVSPDTDASYNEENIPLHSEADSDDRDLPPVDPPSIEEHTLPGTTTEVDNAPAAPEVQEHDASGKGVEEGEEEIEKLEATIDEVETTKLVPVNDVQADEEETREFTPSTDPDESEEETTKLVPADNVEVSEEETTKLVPADDVEVSEEETENPDSTDTVQISEEETKKLDAGDDVQSSVGRTDEETKQLVSSERSEDQNVLVGSDKVLRKQLSAPVYQLEIPQKRRFTRYWILSVALLFFLLAAILTPLIMVVSYGVNAYATYNLLRAHAYGGVQHLLTVKTIFTGASSHPTSVLDESKLIRARQEIVAAHDDFVQVQVLIKNTSLIHTVTQYLPQYRTQVSQRSFSKSDRYRCNADR